jgi:hypothetical protein
MRNTALALWGLAVILGVVTLYSTADSYTNDDGIMRHAVGWADGMERIGPVLFASAFAAVICGCIFWVGHLLSRNRG